MDKHKPSEFLEVKGTEESLIFSLDAFKTALSIEKLDEASQDLVSQHPGLVAKLTNLHGVPSLDSNNEAIVRRTEFELFHQLRSAQKENPQDVKTVDLIISSIRTFRQFPPIASDFSEEERQVLADNLPNSLFVQAVKPIVPRVPDQTH